MDDYMQKAMMMQQQQAMNKLSHNSLLNQLTGGLAGMGLAGMANGYSAPNYAGNLYPYPDSYAKPGKLEPMCVNAVPDPTAKKPEPKLNRKLLLL